MKSFIIKDLWECRFQLWIIAALLILLLVSSPASAYTENFQQWDSTKWAYLGGISGGKYYTSTYTYSDTYGIHLGAQMNPYYYMRAYYNTAQATNYGAVTLIYNGSPGNHAPTIGFLDVSKSSIANFEISQPGRYELIRSDGITRVYKDGIYLTQAACAAQPYYFTIGHRNNAYSTSYCIFDDYIPTDVETNIVGLPPHTWFVAKDMRSPSLKGLFNNAYVNVYNNEFHYTIANSTAAGLYSYDITDPPTSGQIIITSGTGFDYINCKSVTVSGTDINWTNPSATTPYSKTYIDGDTAVLTYDTGTTYWLPLSYTYQVKILKVGDDGTLSTYATYPVSTQTGSLSIATGAYTQAYYYAALIANPISAPTTDYYLDNDLMFLSTGLVKVYGTVYDSSTGATIASQVVGISQSAAWNNATSDGAGAYEKNSFQSGLPISFTVVRSGYQTHTFSFTPIEGGSYLCNMYLTPLPPAISDGSTTVFGYTLSTPYSQAVSGATVNLWNGTYTTSTTATSCGYYEFNNLYNNTVYNINASATGFGSNTSTVTTGAANSTTYKALWLTGGFDVTVQTRDAATNALITNSVETTLVTIATQTSTTGSTTFTSVAYGTYGLSAACSGYNPETGSVVVTGDTTVTLYLDPIAAPTYPTPVPNPNQTPAQGSGISYPPHQVRFLIQDTYGRPIQYALVTATPVESTTPWSWLTSWIGINSTVNVQGQTLSGTTGRDGSWDTMMVESVRYTIQVTNATQGINHAIDLYPKEESYTIWINLKGTKNLTQYPSWVLDAQTYNATYISLNMSYRDIAGKTTTLTYWVKSVDNTLIYSKVYTNPAAGYTNWSYQVLNTNGGMYYFGFNASNSDYGNVTGAKGITMHGSGPLVDFGITDTSWYMWFALLFMFLIGGIFSAKNIFLGAVVTPLWGGLLFTYIGWIPWYMGAGIVGAGISIAVGLGVLAYMRQQEYKLRV
jgi:hypothetical protein